MDFQIDPALQALIPPLPPDERALLEANILRDGCRDPLVVWVEEPERQRTLLLDGHNRYEICTRHALPFTTVDIELPDRVAAAEWIAAFQLCRWTLTPMQRSLIRGRLYNLMMEEKNRHRIVYVIQARSGGPVKIGIANNPPARLRQLQTGSPVPLRIVDQFPARARTTEKALHWRFARHRLHGEWFDEALLPLLLQEKDAAL